MKSLFLYMFMLNIVAHSWHFHLFFKQNLLKYKKKKSINFFKVPLFAREKGFKFGLNYHIKT